MKKLFLLFLLPVSLYGQVSDPTPAPEAGSKFWFKFANCTKIHPYPKGNLDCENIPSMQEQFAIGGYGLDPLYWLHPILFQAEWDNKESRFTWRPLKVKDDIRCLFNGDLSVSEVPPAGDKMPKKDLDRYIRTGARLKKTKTMAKTDNCSFRVSRCGKSILVEKYP
jgi:hypothetical protein